jgi:spore germination protein GerM
MQKHVSPRPRSRKRFLPWLILIVVLFVIGLVVGALQMIDSRQPQPTVVIPEARETREVTLYFAAEDAQSLVAETRLINECTKDEDCVRDTVQALIAGSQNGLVPIFPAQTKLRDVILSESLAQVDFSDDLIAAHPGGTQSELLTVYGLTNTLAVNFPHIRQVQILVAGRAVATLKGHVDLRQPVSPDFSLVDEGRAPLGGAIDVPARSGT